MTNVKQVKVCFQYQASTHAWANSIIFIIINLVFGLLMRICTLEFVATGFIQQALLDFFATLEDIAYFFEFNDIYDHSGGFPYFCIVLLYQLITNRTYLGGSPNPTYMVPALTGYDRDTKFNKTQALILILLQMSAGFAALCFADVVWTYLEPFGFVLGHSIGCQAELVVPIMIGFLIEALFSAVGVGHNFESYCSASDQADNCLKAGVMALAMTLNQGTTGGIFNPAAALGSLFFCPELMTLNTLVIVYVLGPFVGALTFALYYQCYYDVPT